MARPEEDMLFVAHLQQPRTPDRTRRQVEWRVAFDTYGILDCAVLCEGVETAQVVDWQRKRTGRLDDLPRLAVLFGEVRPQTFVARYDRRDRATQCILVQPPPQSPRLHEGVFGTLSGQPIDEPQPLLRKR